MADDVNIWRDTNGVIRVENKVGRIIDEEVAKQDLRTILSLAEQKPVFLYVDARNVTSINIKARVIFSSIENARAMAIHVSSPMSQLMGNFFLKTSKAKFLIKLFYHENLAINWLLENKQKEL